MRDPERIDGVLEEVKKLWKQYPDLRLGQLIVNVHGGMDPFYLEDNELVRKISIAESKWHAVSNNTGNMPNMR